MGHAIEETRTRPVGLVRYDAACRALALAKSVDEVKHIRGAASALRAYAKQAKNRQLEIDAVEIRIRAERRVGELIAAQKESNGLAPAGRRKLGSKITQLEKPTLAAAGIDKNLADRARKLAAVPEQKFDQLIESWRGRTEQDGERVTGEILKPAKHAVHQSSETPEHYTPTKLLALVVACLGRIDLDPCSNPGSPNVPARQRYTMKDDGLEHEWRGRVYMNPPYGRTVDAWVEKLVAEHQSGRVPEAIALLPARPDTQWFRRLRDYLCCFVEGRLTFIGNEDPAPFPSVVVYLGEDIGKFYNHFSGLGDIWQRIEPGMFGD